MYYGVKRESFKSSSIYEIIFDKHDVLSRIRTCMVLSTAGVIARCVYQLSPSARLPRLSFSRVIGGLPLEQFPVMR